MTETSGATRRAPSVLVVEDETDVCAVIHDCLDGEGYRVVCANNDASAYR